MEYKPQNQLAKAVSPYLRQHKDNPVHWQPWGPAAFAQARAENKPVLLSVGYAACHWCHVMAHESFENPAIAGLMNRLFVNIKLDREERPDLDQLYQQALALMGRQGGWPLTMFLDHAGAPFWGGTYFPPVPRHGLPGFVDVLQGVAASFAQEQDKIAFNAQSLRDAIAARQSPPPAPPVTPEIIARAAAHLMADIDARHGGLGPAPKFPQLARLRLLWDHALRAGMMAGSDAVLHSLLQMCRGGLYDHLGGGFHRYCVDAEWRVPHFEKMIDDQAMFIDLLADVVSHHAHPLLLRALEETIAFVLRDLRCEETGLFISSLDADSPGGEGAFYLWTKTEIDALLGPQGDLFCTVYNIEAGGNWAESPVAGGNILHRLQGPAARDDDAEELLRLCRKKLFYARRERPAPARDSKVIIDANARLIAALANAGWRLDRRDWQEAAQDLWARLQTHLPQPVHILGGDDVLLGDYAELALCALRLQEYGLIDGLDAATRWAADMVSLFGRDDGGLQARPSRDDDGFMALLPLYDTPAPAALAVALGVFTRLSLLHAADLRWAGYAGRLAAVLAAPARADFAMMASAMTALQFYQNPVQLHGDLAFWADIARRYTPAALWLQEKGATALRLCQGSVCEAPLHTREDAAAALTQVLRRGLHKAANG